MPSKAVRFDKEMTPQKMRISAEVYQQMGAAGIFLNHPRVELIDGEIYTMTPLSPLHNSHVDKISRFFNKVLFDEVLVRTQGSIRTDAYSEPEPDVAILHLDKNFYSKRQVTSKDIHLIVEVAVLTVQNDRTVKLKKYASSGIPEYWIVIPKKKIVEVYRKPEDDTYLEKQTYRKKGEWIFEAFNLTVKGSDLLI